MFRGDQSDLHEDKLVHARQEGRRDSAKEEVVRRNATSGISLAKVGGKECGWIERHRTRAISSGVGVLPADAVANTALDANWISPSREVFEFVGEERAYDHAEQGWQDGGVRAALVYHETRRRLHHRSPMQEAGERCGHGDCAGDFGTLRKDDGGIAEDCGLRSRWRRAEESQNVAHQEHRERDISQGQGVVGRIGTEHGSQGPPGTRVVGGVDRNDQAPAIWIQQAPRKNVGGVCPEGACGDFGSKFDALRAELDGSRSGNVAMARVMKRRTERRREEIPHAV